MADVSIERLRNEQLTTAAEMLARAFVSNPLHVAAFGPGQVARNEAFFREGLRRMKGPMYAAIEAERILGLIHWADAPACQFSGVEKLAMLPAMVRNFGVQTSLHLGSWLSTWSRHDPSAPHVHLGPIGVAPGAQGRGIGRQLMQLYCEQLDRAAMAGYLETDRPENVGFYARFGFEVTAETPVLGVPNFFMARPPRR